MWGRACRETWQAPHQPQTPSDLHSMPTLPWWEPKAMHWCSYRPAQFISHVPVKTRGFPNSCWEAGSYNRGIPEPVNSWAGPRTRLVTFYDGLFLLDTSFAGSGVPYVLPASEGSATLLLHGCEVRYYCHCDSRLRHRGPPSWPPARQLGRWECYWNKRWSNN